MRKRIRNRLFALATFWKRYVSHEGVKLFVAEFHGRMVGEEKVDALIGSLLREGYRIVERCGPSLALVRDPPVAGGTARA